MSNLQVSNLKQCSIANDQWIEDNNISLALDLCRWELERNLPKPSGRDRG